MMFCFEAIHVFFWQKLRLPVHEAWSRRVGPGKEQLQSCRLASVYGGVCAVAAYLIKSSL